MTFPVNIKAQVVAFTKKESLCPRCDFQSAPVSLSLIKQPEDRQKERLLKIQELADKYFRAALKISPAAQDARAYLVKRQLNSEATKIFAIGYSPDSWDGLIKFLRKKGFSQSEIKQSGLAVVKDNGSYYDRFRGRLMFALRNQFGDIIGFAGRSLNPAEKGAKYINSSDSQLYHKSDFLYNLDLAKTFIRKSNFAIVVEGYTDVISAYSSGTGNVVASSGTSLTLGQINLLKRFTPNLALAYDADSAGDKATKRGIELALGLGMNLKIVNLPADQDPDDLIRQDKKLWLGAIKDKVSVIDFYFSQVFQARDLSKIEDKKLIAKNLLPFIGSLPDPIEKALYLKKLARLLDVSETVLQEALMKSVPANTSTPIRPVAVRARTVEIETLAGKILGWLIAFPQLKTTVKSAGLARLFKYFDNNEQVFRVYQKFEKLYNKASFKLDNLLANLSEIEGTKVKFLVLRAEHTTAGLAWSEVEEQFNQLISLAKKQKIKSQLAGWQSFLIRAEEAKDDRRVEVLTVKIQRLLVKLKSI